MFLFCGALLWWRSACSAQIKLCHSVFWYIFFLMWKESLSLRYMIWQWNCMIWNSYFAGFWIAQTIFSFSCFIWPEMCPTLWMTEMLSWLLPCKGSRCLSRKIRTLLILTHLILISDTVCITWIHHPSIYPLYCSEFTLAVNNNQSRQWGWQ